MKDERVTLKEAKELYRQGFNLPTNHIYKMHVINYGIGFDIEWRLEKVQNIYGYANQGLNDVLSAPTREQVEQWKNNKL